MSTCWFVDSAMLTLKLPLWNWWLSNRKSTLGSKLRSWKYSSNRSVEFLIKYSWLGIRHAERKYHENVHEMYVASCMLAKFGTATSEQIHGNKLARDSHQSDADWKFLSSLPTSLTYSLEMENKGSDLERIHNLLTCSGCDLIVIMLYN